MSRRQREQRNREIMNLMVMFYRRHHALPPGTGVLIHELCRHPRGFLRFCHELAEIAPDVMHAIMVTEHDDDGGPESDCGPFPPKMQLDPHGTVERVEQKTFEVTYQ